MARRFQDPLAWSAASKCLFAAAVFGTVTLWYWLVLYFVRAHPEWAPYLDPRVAPTLLRVQSLTLGAWIVLLVASLGAQRWRPQSGLLVSATLLVAGWELVYGSYCFGILTSIFPGLTLLGTFAVGLVLFERRTILALFAAVLLALAGLSFAEQRGLIPYAPLFREAPYQGGRLHPSWVVGTGGVTMLMTVFVGAIVYYVIDRWHDREAALAVARAQLERATALLRRYVPGQLADRILEGSYSRDVRPERRKLTLFFSDIAGFTEAADRMEPEDLAAVLNEYMSEMVAIAECHGATVNQFVGDGIMAFFGAPEATEDRDHALRCVRMALAMQERMAELRRRWFEAGVETPFAIRIGINTGMASVGDFGSTGRTTYSAIGNQTNLTARIQEACEPGKVLLSHSTWALVKDELPCTERGRIEVKGIHYPVRIYEVEEPAGTG